MNNSVEAFCVQLYRATVEKRKEKKIYAKLTQTYTTHGQTNEELKKK